MPQTTHPELISQNEHSTIMAYYEPRKTQRKGYQSEAELEAKLLKDLQAQGYEYLPIKQETELLENLKLCLERLNGLSFSAREWERFCSEHITNPQKGRSEKTRILQTDMETLSLQRDDGSFCNIRLLDRENLYKNHLQVISQLENEGKALNRYDVSILLNGLPLVHIELKRRGVNLKEAFDQIKRYARESFSAGNALFEFVQIFVISNGTMTRYYSNSTRDKLSNTQNQNNHFAFTINFSCAQNNAILELEDFTKSFFAKRTLLQILSKYCVFNAEQELLVMRPYQIAATEKIIDKIRSAHHHKFYGSTQAGGYIWHSTGSGKTLTSFKTAILSAKFDFIKKVLFVVDRKDLDYQTMKEYEKFQKGAANATKNTEALKQLLESNQSESKIIITTIQKLSKFIQKYNNSAVFSQEIVFIFDECHRSQFGQMHELIIKKFKAYYFFGFTGTPIFEKNANKSNRTAVQTYNELGQALGKRSAVKTTDIVFGDCLHSYTIVNAIADKNVLPFRLEYISTMKKLESSRDEKVQGINTEEALNHPQRIQKIVSYILEHFDQKTKRSTQYKYGNDKKMGFNSLLATASIESAKAYYQEFKKQNANNAIKVGIIYTYAQNEDLDEFDMDGLDSEQPNADSKAFLESTIKDYNAMFQGQFSLQRFDEYHEEIARSLKNKDLDLLIVVDMFLTGFDSKTLNTLWVDKNLRFHSLLQAYSRTNRILNNVKAFGNIVCFRDLEHATNESLQMFGDKDAKSIVLLRSFEEYLHGFVGDSGEREKGYLELISELQSYFPLQAFPLASEGDQKDFIELFGAVLRLENILNAFDDFEMHNSLSIEDKQDYQSHYIELHRAFRQEKQKADISDELIFEIELIKQTEVNVDYILFLLENYHKDSTKTTREGILRALSSSVSLQSKKELILAFLENLDNVPNGDFDTLFKEFISLKKQQELEELITQENLLEGTRAFMNKAFTNKHFQEFGTALDDVLPPIPIFASSEEEKNTKRF